MSGVLSRAVYCSSYTRDWRVPPGSAKLAEQHADAGGTAFVGVIPLVHYSVSVTLFRQAELFTRLRNVPVELPVCSTYRGAFPYLAVRALFKQTHESLIFTVSLSLT